MYEVIVDNDKCIGCGECVDICPVEVYELRDEKSVPVNAEECVGCESCIEVCEQDAITVREIGSAAA
jgi:NAD-dependent dihydropyrimidine dehydrogenase PreA subunit